MQELVEIKRDRVVCTSLQVAEKFGKRHDRVLRAIENIKFSLPKNGVVDFRQSNYLDAKGEQRKMYYMNRDAFSLLVMGFTGEKALEWKLKYINAFNEMEKVIAEKQTQEWIETRNNGKIVRKELTDVLQQLAEYAKEQGSEHSDMLYVTYTKLVNKAVKVNGRDKASIVQLNTLTLIEHMVLSRVQIGMWNGLHYKEIYKDCKQVVEQFTALTYFDSLIEGGTGCQRLSLQN